MILSMAMNRRLMLQPCCVKETQGRASSGQLLSRETMLLFVLFCFGVLSSTNCVPFKKHSKLDNVSPSLVI